MEGALCFAIIGCKLTLLSEAFHHVPSKDIQHMIQQNNQVQHDMTLHDIH